MYVLRGTAFLPLFVNYSVFFRILPYIYVVTYIRGTMSEAADKSQRVVTMYLLNVLRPQSTQYRLFAKRHIHIEHLPGYNKND
jgi:hypothetical protein